MSEEVPLKSAIEIPSIPTSIRLPHKANSLDLEEFAIQVVISENPRIEEHNLDKSRSHVAVSLLSNPDRDVSVVSNVLENVTASVSEHHKIEPRQRSCWSCYCCWNCFKWCCKPTIDNAHYMYKRRQLQLNDTKVNSKVQLHSELLQLTSTYIDSSVSPELNQITKMATLIEKFENESLLSLMMLLKFCYKFPELVRNYNAIQANLFWWIDISKYCFQICVEALYEDALDEFLVSLRFVKSSLFYLYAGALRHLAERLIASEVIDSAALKLDVKKSLLKAPKKLFDIGKIKCEAVQESLKMPS